MALTRLFPFALAIGLAAGPALADRPSRLAAAEAAIDHGDVQAAEHHVRLALSAPLDASSLDRARLVLERAVRLRDERNLIGPDSAPALALLGTVELASGRAPEAENSYRRALEGTPDHTLLAAALRSDLAAAVAAEGRLGEAITLQRLALAQAETALATFDDVRLLPFVERLTVLVGPSASEEANLLTARRKALEARQAKARSLKEARASAEAPHFAPVFSSFRPDPWTIYQEQQYQAATGIRP